MGSAEPTTKTEWAAEVLRPDPVPPNRPATFSGYRHLAPGKKQAVEDARMDYHSALGLVRTAQMEHIHTQVRRMMRANRYAPTGARIGVLVDGLPNVGKSTTVREMGRQTERDLRRRFPERFDQEGRLYLPVVFISLESGSTEKKIASQIAHYLGVPVTTRQTPNEVTRVFSTLVKECGTELLILDEVQFVDLNTREGRKANDYLKHLANTLPVTVLLAGANLADASGIFTDGTGASSTRTGSRFQIHTLRPFAENLRLERRTKEIRAQERREWMQLILTLEDALDLYRHERGALARHEWRYLLDRTQGRFGALSDLIRRSAQLAIEDGSEQITRRLMNEVFLDYESERDRTAAGY